MVKIVSVTVEIFLIGTNFARTNVAWTNIILAVGRSLVKIRSVTVEKMGIKLSQSQFELKLRLGSAIQISWSHRKC